MEERIRIDDGQVFGIMRNWQEFDSREEAHNYITRQIEAGRTTMDRVVIEVTTTITKTDEVERLYWEWQE